MKKMIKKNKMEIIIKLTVLKDKVLKERKSKRKDLTSHLIRYSIK